jgi:hypothetical protein
MVGVFAQFDYNKFLLGIQYKKILKDSMYLNVMYYDWIENGLDKKYAEVIDLGSFDKNLTIIIIIVIYEM